ncbi:MAG: S8 family serine peptidase, partial [Candidatus Latescibacteria bacterium]|nr:S8 family serine peptidase [Candidatus Latescibacterota bacterium]
EYEKARRAWEEGLSPRVLRRRAKVPPRTTVADFRDLPVLQNYVDTVEACGLKVRTISRWFNGVSVRATAKQIVEVEKYPFVRSIAPVSGFRRGQPKEVQKKPSEKARKPVGAQHRLDYGGSYAQLAMIHVPALHDAGWDGSGIRIGLLDSGFGAMDHEVFQRIDIVRQWDFVDGDEDVSGHPHGTQVLSVIGGYKEGALIGPAYGAQYLLARTEDVASETPVEEDYWIAGVEWADEMGADIVSTSLGYNIWDEGTGEDYTYADLDGNTARITMAADWAVERGITVICAVGNEGDDPWYYALFPADGDGVIAVGAVTPDGSPAAFSSRGPTSDGRIKPDVAAPGVNIRMAGGAPDSYTLSRGTSYAAPLTAGVAALLLQAHPEWGPMDVREAMRRSGDHALNPDNEVGWGLINAEAAMDAERTLYGRVVDADSGRPLSMAAVAISSDAFEASTTTGGSGRFLFAQIPSGTYTIVVRAPRYIFARLKDISIPDNLTGFEVNLREAIDVGDLVYNVPNPFGPEGTCISFPMKECERVCVRIFTPSGALVWETEHSEENDRWNVLWHGRNLTGNRVGSGIYFYVIEGDGINLR